VFPSSQRNKIGQQTFEKLRAIAVWDVLCDISWYKFRNLHFWRKNKKPINCWSWRLPHSISWSRYWSSSGGE